MLRHDLHALLYAPFRFVIARDEAEKVTLTFVQPSTQFDSLRHPQITEVGTSLDATVARILSLIDLTPPEGLTLAQLPGEAHQTPAG